MSAQDLVTRRIDSLIKRVKVLKEDTFKIQTLNELGRELIAAADYKRTRLYMDTVIELENKLNYKEGMAWTHNILGHIERDKGNYPGALRNYNVALQTMKEIGHKRGEAICYGNLGIIFDAQGNFSEALNSHMAALRIFQNIGNKQGIASSNSNIGNIYNDLGNYPAALEKRLIALKLHHEIGNMEGIGSGYYYIGRIYINLQNYPEALKNLLLSLKIRKQIGGKRTIAGSYHNIGVVYEKMGNYNEALKNHMSALEIQDSIGDKLGSANSNDAIGVINMKEKRFDTALINFGNSIRLREEIGDKEGMAISYINMGNLLSMLAAEKNNRPASLKYDEAVSYLNKGLLLSKQINTKASERLACNYLSEIYSKTGDYKRALDYKNRYILLSDSIFNDESARKLEQLRIQFEVESAVAREKELQEKGKALHKRENEQMMAAFGMFAIIVFFSVMLFVLRNQKKRAVEKAEAAHKMGELELQSLRAQLNPHFMFNSLNAIQELILMEDNERSHIYLSRFSKLIRILLDNASQPFIPLKKEIDFLELYLSLEKLRIPDLQYSIEIDPGIDTNQTSVPNMMLQPYIENAIWHGLSPKTSDKKLVLRIYRQNGTILYEIEDNGIGRQKAAELKGLYRKEHKSKGMELLTKRFKLLSEEFGSEIKTTVTDMPENENAEGTRVTISVPRVLSGFKKEATT